MQHVRDRRPGGSGWRLTLCVVRNLSVPLACWLHVCVLRAESEKLLWSVVRSGTWKSFCLRPCQQYAGGLRYVPSALPYVN